MGNVLHAGGMQDGSRGAQPVEKCCGDPCRPRGGRGINWEYTYNNRNEIIVAKEYNGNPATGGTLVQEVDYQYDFFGNCVSETVVGSATEQYLMDGWNPALAGATGNSGWQVWGQLTNGSLTVNMYGDAANQLFASIGSDGLAPVWMWTDRQGSVAAQVDQTGNVIVYLNYDAFGNMTIGTPSGVAVVRPYGWDGEELDTATGLYADGARYYNPATGRFLTQDPMGLAAGDPNVYRYVGNSPTNATDPSGNYIFFINPASASNFCQATNQFIPGAAASTSPLTSSLSVLTVSTNAANLTSTSPCFPPSWWQAIVAGANSTTNSYISNADGNLVPVNTTDSSSPYYVPPWAITQAVTIVPPPITTQAPPRFTVGTVPSEIGQCLDDGAYMTFSGLTLGAFADPDRDAQMLQRYGATAVGISTGCGSLALACTGGACGFGLAGVGGVGTAFGGGMLVGASYEVGRESAQMIDGTRAPGNYNYGAIGQFAVFGGVLGPLASALTTPVVQSIMAAGGGLSVGSAIDQLFQGHYATAAFDGAVGLGTLATAFAPNNGGNAGNLRPINPARAGIDPHALKPDFVGSRAGQFNIAVDGNGQVVLVPVRAGAHPNVPTGLTLEQAAQLYPN
jgi:RHS repeat-associated protein